MSIRPPTINGEKNTAVVAITAALIGITLVVSLLVMGLIGEATFATLFTVISLICLFIAFSNRVESISLKELTIKLAKVQEIQQAVIAKETEPPHQLQGIGLRFATRVSFSVISKTVSPSSACIADHGRMITGM